MASVSTFFPNETLNADTNPKDVGYLLATTVNEDDAVVFTKASLVQFLKTHGVQVDTNYTELKRLPKYATFGRFSAAASVVATSGSGVAAAPVPAASKSTELVRDNDGREFRPTRRVREEIGGGSAQITALFGSDDDALAGRRAEPQIQNIEGRPRGPARPSRPDPIHPPQAQYPISARSAGAPRNEDETSYETLAARPNGKAPPSEGDPTHPAQSVEAAKPFKEEAQNARIPQQQQQQQQQQGFVPSKGVRDSEGREFRPTRRVREAIGGGSEQIASLFGGGDDSGSQENYPPRRKRGTFIVVEGLDRAGKSTQVDLLAERLQQVHGEDNVRIRKFPDRTTPLGKVLNTYLTSSDVALHPRAAHLLFSANRWELTTSIMADLAAGVTTIADRYVASGIAYSLVKELPLDWLIQPDRALPSPDLTIFLSISASEAAKRGGYGNERYEKEEIQAKVRGAFQRVQKVFAGELTVGGTTAGVSSGEWKVIDAGRERDTVWRDVWAEVKRVDDDVQRSGRQVAKLFV